MLNHHVERRTPRFHVGRYIVRTTILKQVKDVRQSLDCIPQPEFSSTFRFSASLHGSASTGATFPGMFSEQAPGTAASVV